MDEIWSNRIIVEQIIEHMNAADIYNLCEAHKDTGLVHLDVFSN